MSNDVPPSMVRRRSWPGIVALLLIIAVVGGTIAWFTQSSGASATALFQVGMETPSLVDNQAGRPGAPEANYETFKKTQVALLKSKFLLTSALRDPAIAGSPVFGGVGDREEWLNEHLQVGYPQNGEILEITLRGPRSQAEELVRVVDAIAEAYKKEALGAATARQLSQRDMVERSLQNLNGEIKRKFEDYIDISKGMGRSGSDNDPETQIDMKRMDRIDEELAQLEREQIRIETGADNKDSKFIAARITQLRKSQADLLKAIQKRNERSVDLITRKKELDQLQMIADELSMKLERLDLDSQMPSRIRQVQAAVPTKVALW